MTQAIDWAAFPGPTYYRPDEVPQVFEALASAANYEEADAAYTKLTYTVGTATQARSTRRRSLPCRK